MNFYPNTITPHISLEKSINTSFKMLKIMYPKRISELGMDLPNRLFVKSSKILEILDLELFEWSHCLLQKVNMWSVWVKIH